jgi:hypothetical protein
MKRNRLLIAALMALPFSGFAQDEEESSWTDKLPFEISGAVDVYTKTNFIPK